VECPEPFRSLMVSDEVGIFSEGSLLEMDGQDRTAARSHASWCWLQGAGPHLLGLLLGVRRGLLSLDLWVTGRASQLVSSRPAPITARPVNHRSRPSASRSRVRPSRLRATHLLRRARDFRRHLPGATPNRRIFSIFFPFKSGDFRCDEGSFAPSRANIFMARA
jgi:hypothetical protein